MSVKAGSWTIEKANAAIKSGEIEPGVEMPAHVYHATEAISHSMIKQMRGSAAKCKWMLDHPREASAAQDLGSAIHMAVLEPEKFDEHYAVMPKVDRRTKAGKETVAEWEEKNKSKKPLDQEDFDTVLRVTKRIANDEFFSRFFIPGVKERSFFAKDELTNLILRCRPDNFVPNENGGWIVDLKTTEDSSRHAFHRDIAKYGYDTQMAFYVDVVEVATGKRPEGAVIVAVEKSMDCDVTVTFFSEEELALHRRRYRGWLERYAACLKTGIWEGYPKDFLEYKSPEWIRAELT